LSRSNNLIDGLRRFREYVGSYIIVVWYVLKLNPLEVAFELANLSTVSIHCVFNSIPLFVDLFDDDLGIVESQ
jgi:hypothetical protein